MHNLLRMHILQPTQSLLNYIGHLPLSEPLPRFHQQRKQVTPLDPLLDKVNMLLITEVAVHRTDVLVLQPNVNLVLSPYVLQVSGVGLQLAEVEHFEDVDLLVLVVTDEKAVAVLASGEGFADFEF